MVFLLFTLEIQYMYYNHTHLFYSIKKYTFKKKEIFN